MSLPHLGLVSILHTHTLASQNVWNIPPSSLPLINSQSSVPCQGCFLQKALPDCKSSSGCFLSKNHVCSCERAMNLCLPHSARNCPRDRGASELAHQGIFRAPHRTSGWKLFCTLVHFVHDAKAGVFALLIWQNQLDRCRVG